MTYLTGRKRRFSDQSVAITDYYSEQIKTGHLSLSGSGKPGRSPGRVSISAVKSDCRTSREITVENYHGSLVRSAQICLYLSQIFA